METKPNPKRQFANLIRSYRCKAGYSQLYLSYSIGYTSNSMISRVEMGVYIPTPKTAMKMARFLEIPKEKMYDALLAIEAEKIKALMDSADLA